MDHLSEELILRYVSNTVSEQEEVEIYTHLADCSECLQRVRTLRYIQENLDTLWDSWTADEHGRVYKEWREVKALREAEQTLAGMGLELPSMAAVIAATKQGFLTVYRNIEKYVCGPPPVPVLAALGIKSEKVPKADELERSLPCLEIDSREGLRVLIVQVPGRGSDVYIDVTEPPFEGWVRLVQFVPHEGKAQEKDLGIKVRLADGKARFEDCPLGALKVVASGDGSDRSVPFYLIK